MDSASSHSDDSLSDNELKTEHYLKVEKSALRNDELPSKYTGVKVSRKDLENSDALSNTSDADSGIEGNSDDDLNTSDLDQDSDWDQELPADSDADSNADSHSDAEPSESLPFELDILQKLQAQDHEQKITSKLADSAVKDTEKGIHVKNQITLWDSLLAIRIKCQKQIQAANTLPQPADYDTFMLKYEDDEEVTEALEEAREECMGFLDELVDVRLKLLQQDDITGDFKRKHIQDTTSKRKRTEWLDSTWDDVIMPISDAFKPHRNAVIEKWSAKVAGANAIPLKKFKVVNQSIVAQIEGAVGAERLIQRTRLKREEYAVLGKFLESGLTKAIIDGSVTADDINGDTTQDKHLTDYDPEIFDDGDFYHQLLKDLIDSRLDSSDPVLLGMRVAQLKQLQSKKTKKTVDTRASKGRKIRYQVLEKIQNFMAPEPRGTWHDAMADELFAGLFGGNESGGREIEVDLAEDGFKIM